VREGFEPSKAEPPDLQSGPFDRSGTSPINPHANITLKKRGAGDGTRTRDLLITNQLLYQLSYASPGFTSISKKNVCTEKEKPHNE
jgi:hypothetical protein